jgi:hypothetical protein
VLRGGSQDRVQSPETLCCGPVVSAAGAPEQVLRQLLVEAADILAVSRGPAHPLTAAARGWLAAGRCPPALAAVVSGSGWRVVGVAVWAARSLPYSSFMIHMR